MERATLGPKLATVPSPGSQFGGAFSPSSQPTRLLSLDLLRGLTIAFMILVNNAGDFGSAYWPLLHSAWNGCTPTDVVFPTFLFIIGITTVISTSSRLSRGTPKRTLLLQIVRRAVILFLLGILVNSFPFFNLHTMRFFGILPRISVCYFAVATLYLFSQGWRDKLALFIAILIGYWMLLRFVPVPGYGVPTRGVPFMDPLGNLAFWVDRSLFSASHLSDGTHDITGLGSTLPSIATTLLGVLTAQWLRTSHAFTKKVGNIALAGVAAILLGGVWNFTFPINKELWTSSFVLFAGGISMLLLALFMWIFDRTPAASSGRARSPLATALLVFGTNAITAYVFSELLASGLSSIPVHRGTNLQELLYQSILSVVPDAAFASLLYSLAYVGVCWIFTYSLYRRRTFIKI
ncbi:MAG: acyltransferase family protein [Acidobacteriaceae bacterium]